MGYSRQASSLGRCQFCAREMHHSRSLCRHCTIWNELTSITEKGGEATETRREQWKMSMITGGEEEKMRWFTGTADDGAAVGRRAAVAAISPFCSAVLHQHADRRHGALCAGKQPGVAAQCDIRDCYDAQQALVLLTSLEVARAIIHSRAPHPGRAAIRRPSMQPTRPSTLTTCRTFNAFKHAVI